MAASFRIQLREVLFRILHQILFATRAAKEHVATFYRHFDRRSHPAQLLARDGANLLRSTATRSASDSLSKPSGRAGADVADVSVAAFSLAAGAAAGFDEQPTHANPLTTTSTVANHQSFNLDMTKLPLLRFLSTAARRPRLSEREPTKTVTRRTQRCRSQRRWAHGSRPAQIRR